MTKKPGLTDHRQPWQHIFQISFIVPSVSTSIHNFGSEAEQASKAAAEAAAAAKEVLQSKINELVSSGMSVEEILEKLK